MKGIVFTEFLDLVEAMFSIEIAERLIDESELPSRGAYTTIGTYDASEMVALVKKLSDISEVPVSKLLRDFGFHLAKRFAVVFPEFFEGKNSCVEFLPSVESYVHLEVRKLYPDAELPRFVCSIPAENQLDMIYISERNLPDLAEGLVLGCADLFGEKVKIERSSVAGEQNTTLFNITFLEKAQ